MGKKRSRSTYISKGERRNVSKETTKLVAASQSGFFKELNLRRAWKKGQNPWVTVPGPDAKRRFIRERANAVWGDPKRRGSMDNKNETYIDGLS